MAIAEKKSPNEPQPYTVLRAMCMGGERVDVGGTVELTLTQYTELATAGKVGPFDPKAEARLKAEAKRVKAEAEALKKAQDEADAARQKADEEAAAAAFKAESDKAPSAEA